MKLFFGILNFFELQASGDYYKHENIGQYKNLSNTKYNEIESFDLQSSFNFIENIGKTSCFSPLYEEVIRLCQEFRDTIDEDTKAYVKEKLWRIYKLIRIIDPKVLDIYFNHIEGDSIEQSFINQGYTTKKASDSFKDLDPSTHLSQNFVKFLAWNFHSHVVIDFKGKWAERFETYQNKNDDFTTSRSNKISRTYINKSCYERNRRITIDGIVFDMVILSLYSDYTNVGYRSLMVYLIPTNPVNLTSLWKAFINHSTSKGGIWNSILDCCPSKFNLYIPKLYTAKSYTYHSHVPEFLENQTHKCPLKLSFETHIKICELGKTPHNLKFDNLDFTKYDTDDEPTIKANVPYISFLYDMEIDRILLIFKDIGSK